MKQKYILRYEVQQNMFILSMQQLLDGFHGKNSHLLLEVSADNLKYCEENYFLSVLIPCFSSLVFLFFVPPRIDPDHRMT